MKKKIKFYKEDGEWYADVPGHTKAKNRMVAGADKFLGYLDKEKKGIVNMEVGTEDANKEYRYSLFRLHHDKYGGTYLVKKKGYRLASSIIWICNVTHTVLGEHPKNIYIYCIK